MDKASMKQIADEVNDLKANGDISKLLEDMQKQAKAGNYSLSLKRLDNRVVEKLKQLGYTTYYDSDDGYHTISWH